MSSTINEQPSLPLIALLSSKSMDFFKNLGSYSIITEQDLINSWYGSFISPWATKMGRNGKFLTNIWKSVKVWENIICKQNWYQVALLLSKCMNTQIDYEKSDQFWHFSVNLRHRLHLHNLWICWVRKFFLWVYFDALKYFFGCWLIPAAWPPLSWIYLGTPWA